MKKNLTLTIDDDVLRGARKLAVDRNTSVNELVRSYLKNLVQESDRQTEALKSLEKLWSESKFRLGGPITWTRDELYDRK